MPADDVVNEYHRRIYVDPADSRGRALVRSGGDFNPLSTAMWRHVLALRPRWDVVLDVGANYGEMLAGADLAHADQIIAFEPNPSIATQLRRTIAELPWPVVLREEAVGSAPRRARFVIDDNWSGKSHLADGGSGQHGIDVPVTSVDVALAATRVQTAAIKVDVEGAEMDVLAGMQGTTERAEVVVVMLEILHMSVQQVAVLTRSMPIFLMTADGLGLVRLPTDDPMTTGLVLHDGSTHRENAIVVLGADTDRFIAETSALSRMASPAPSDEAAALRERLRLRERELRELRRFADRRSVRLVARLTDRLGALRRTGR